MKATIFSTEQLLSIDVPGGSIEALYGNQNSSFNAIICAPHPHHDGSMHNKVVATLTSVCLELKLNTLRFNYRGVGASTGSLPTYSAALQDVTFVLNFLESKPTICLGFSYGGYVAAYATGLVSSRGLITVAPSVAKMPFADLPDIKCPWHMIQGMQDEVIDVSANKKLALSKQCQWHAIPETSHFFHGKLSILRETVRTIIAEILEKNA